MIEKLKQKDEAAFGEFIDHYQKMVINICFKFTQDRQEAQDIAQEVFIEIYLSINKFKGNSKITTWLYRISANKSLDFLKRKKRKKRFAVITSIFGLNLDKENYLKSASNPHSILEVNEKMKLLVDSIDKLPENQKVALTLSKLEGLSYLEISEILKTSTSAVDSLIQRAKKNLIKYLLNADF